MGEALRKDKGKALRKDTGKKSGMTRKKVSSRGARRREISLTAKAIGMLNPEPGTLNP
jgi:hypothetical protein